ncbi:hypothetical protein GCM10011352_01820 [Marinobacterium zhoushanense]|uniref:DUF488 domain-containing protein n=1 Tax=Marinobacterium zhoushanense TaxID=1679163 RepID=A0ABQ1K0D2_9GAMM|nr:DUF488 family protein [Marinobacterium zhoushanense]GGB79792.1 hypothetical protein GCM10011352_01820 [Marinobacterium zhoushanense]
MTIRVVRLGTQRAEDEGIRLGTVRRPPRGVKKSEFATQNWYDVWLPILSPSPELVKQAQAATTDKEWAAFEKRFRKELTSPDASHTLDLLTALSKQSNFSIGCYCEDESRCHRRVLREVLNERGAEVE